MPQDIYEPQFVENLFDQMSSSYARMNYITSFGFSERWRKQCVEQLRIQPGKTTVDLMTGMGECWKFVLQGSCGRSALIGIDFSAAMIKLATKNRLLYPAEDITILRENIFNNSLPDQCADYVISGFGMKTFNSEQLNRLANEIQRLLKPGGSFALVDVSVPHNRILRTLYLFYLNRIIPVLGRLFLGNPETYKMLGVYTEAFQNSRSACAIFNRPGLEVWYVEYFFGCASGIQGNKVQTP